MVGILAVHEDPAEDLLLPPPPPGDGEHGRDMLLVLELLLGHLVAVEVFPWYGRTPFGDERTEADVELPERLGETEEGGRRRKGDGLRGRKGDGGRGRKKEEGGRKMEERGEKH